MLSWGVCEASESWASVLYARGLVGVRREVVLGSAVCWIWVECSLARSTGLLGYEVVYGVSLVVMGRQKTGERRGEAIATRPRKIDEDDGWLLAARSMFLDSDGIQNQPIQCAFGNRDGIVKTVGLPAAGRRTCSSLVRASRPAFLLDQGTLRRTKGS